MGCWSGSVLPVQAGSSQTHRKGLHAQPQGSCYSGFTLHTQGETSALRQPVLGASKPEELTGVHTSQVLSFPSFTGKDTGKCPIKTGEEASADQVESPDARAQVCTTTGLAPAGQLTGTFGTLTSYVFTVGLGRSAQDPWQPRTGQLLGAQRTTHGGQSVNKIHSQAQWHLRGFSPCVHLPQGQLLAPGPRDFREQCSE